MGGGQAVRADAKRPRRRWRPGPLCRQMSVGRADRRSARRGATGPRVLLDLDEDALAGALLGGLDHGVELAVGDVGQTGGAARVREHLLALLDVGQAIVEQGEHVRGDLFAESVAGAEILVDPDLHSPCHLFVRGSGLAWGAATGCTRTL